MQNIGLPSLLLIITNFIFSYQGFKANSFIEKYKFEVDKILIFKEYYRIITSGFLHLDWRHLIFNMLSLYLFSNNLEYLVGKEYFLLIYFGSLVGGDLLTLFIHRNHGDYSAVGASGAVAGIIFACIALDPDLEIRLFYMPFFVPGWVFGGLYVLYTIYGIKAQNDNIGHEAHLGGALIGMLIAILIRPNILIENYLAILSISIPSMIFMFILIKQPHFLLFSGNPFRKKQKTYFSIDHKYMEEKAEKQKEIDRILEKISRSGIDSLNKSEKKKLEEYSQNRA